jgi:molybdopterin-guanine dinucleotide biosynthesis protein A
MTQLDLQQIHWLLADGMMRKTEVKELYAQSQGILKNTSGYMHPLCAVAHAKLLSAAAAQAADARSRCANGWRSASACPSSASIR